MSAGLFHAPPRGLGLLDDFSEHLARGPDPGLSHCLPPSVMAAFRPPD